MTATLALTTPAPPLHDEPLLRDMLGGALRRARLKRERTLRDVAHDSRVSLAYLSEIERGQKEPSSEILSAVCGALGITMLELISDVQRGFVAHDIRTAPMLARSAPSGALALAA